MAAIFDWFGYRMPMEERYKIIRQAGFDGVTFWWSDNFGEKDYRNAPQIARYNELFVENIHTPFDGINNLWLDNLDGESITKVMLQCVEDCNTYDIPTMVMHLSSGENTPPINLIGLERVKRIAERAENLNVNIALENTRKTEYLAYVLEKIDSKRLGFCYDSGHQHRWSSEEDLLKKYGLRLMALHLHDNEGSDDQHLLPFKGTIDWKNTMGKIAKLGYAGSTVLEVENVGNETLSAEKFLHLAFKSANKLEAMRNATKI